MPNICSVYFSFLRVCVTSRKQNACKCAKAQRLHLQAVCFLDTIADGERTEAGAKGVERARGRLARTRATRPCRGRISRTRSPATFDLRRKLYFPAGFGWGEEYTAHHRRENYARVRKHLRSPCGINRRLWYNNDEGLTNGRDIQPDGICGG